MGIIAVNRINTSSKLVQITESGFLLTRRQYDRSGACCFELWVKNNSGVKQILIEGERPVCFARSDDAAILAELFTINKIAVQFSELPLQSFQEESMNAMYLRSLKDYQAIKKLAEVQRIELFEHDIKPVDRFLMERFIQGGISYTGKEASGNFQRLVQGKV